MICIPFHIFQQLTLDFHFLLQLYPLTPGNPNTVALNITEILIGQKHTEEALPYDSVQVEPLVSIVLAI